MEQLGLSGVTCGIFNELGSLEFDPIKILTTLNTGFPDVQFPWKSYNFLDLI